MQKSCKSNAIKLACFAEMQLILCKNHANRVQSSLLVLLRCSWFYAKLGFLLIPTQWFCIIGWEWGVKDIDRDLSFKPDEVKSASAPTFLFSDSTIYSPLITRSDTNHFPTSSTSFDVWIGFPLKDISYSPLAMGVTLTKQPLAFCNSTNAPLLLPSFTISRSANSLVRLRMLHIRDRWFCHEGHSLCSRLRREPAVGVRNNII